MDSHNHLSIGFGQTSLNIGLLGLIALTCACNQILGIADLPASDAGLSGDGGKGGMLDGGNISTGGTGMGGSGNGGTAAGGTGGGTLGGAAGSVDAGVVADAACLTGPSTQGPPPQSLAALGGTGEDIMSDLAMDGVNRVVVGSFGGTIKLTMQNVTQTFVATETDALVLKTDAQGRPLWATQISGTGLQNAYAVAVDRLSNIYVAGQFEGTAKFGALSGVSKGKFDVFVTKFAPSGEVVWLRTYGAAEDDYAVGIDTTSDNEIIVTGAFEIEESFGTGVVRRAKNADAFLLRLKPNGDTAWAETFGGLGSDQGASVAVNEKDQIVLAGLYTSKINLGGQDIQLQEDVPGSHSVFVTLRSSSGSFIWSLGMGGGQDFAGDVEFDGEGHVVSSGTFTDTGNFGSQVLTAVGAADMFFARISPTGNMEWVRQFGDEMGAFGYSIIANKTAAYVTGSFWQSATFDGLRLSGPLREGVLAKLDLCTGTTVWAQSFGGLGVDEGYTVAFDPGGNVALVGTYEGKMTFAGKTTTVDVGVGEIFLSTTTP